jgi:hypothetical protein
MIQDSTNSTVLENRCTSSIWVAILKRSIRGLIAYLMSSLTSLQLPCYSLRLQAVPQGV